MFSPTWSYLIALLTDSLKLEWFFQRNLQHSFKVNLPCLHFQHTKNHINNLEQYTNWDKQLQEMQHTDTLGYDELSK